MTLYNQPTLFGPSYPLQLKRGVVASSLRRVSMVTGRHIGTFLERGEKGYRAVQTTKIESIETLYGSKGVRTASVVGRKLDARA